MLSFAAARLHTHLDWARLGFHDWAGPRLEERVLQPDLKAAGMVHNPCRHLRKGAQSPCRRARLLIHHFRWQRVHSLEYVAPTSSSFWSSNL